MCKTQHYIDCAWWHMPVTPALRRQRQKDQKLKVILREFKETVWDT